MELWTQWWVWLSVALVLGILEVLIPGFVALGFASGAAIVGVLLGVGVLTDFSMPALLVICAVISAVMYVGLRHFFKLEKGQVKYWDKDIND
ncbi:NfeD family protein [Aestuariibius sp. 2305UL40-4]|uniref:NfeD family protein n=1 Tax=Aestuariibius violaceus TaxID=3234132 RepID=UPI00345E5B8E